MNKAKLLKIVNPILAVSFIIQAATGLVFIFKIRVPDLNLVLEIHEHNGIIFMALVVTHIALNWGWIQANFFKKSK